MTTPADSSTPAIALNHLSFHYPSIDGTPIPNLAPVVEDVSLCLESGSRCLLVGPNGAGKTTLLKILGGKHMVSPTSVEILGRSPFHDVSLVTSGDLSYLGGEWVRDIAFAGTNIPLQGDFPARMIIDSVRNVSKSRKDRIMQVLDVNPEWRMHLVSDGQRRRVQICVGLLHPFKVLLLDEITVDLDVLGRADMLKFLKEECEQRGAIIVYATHIFDGLESWPSHIAFLAEGKLKVFSKVDQFPQIQQGRLLSLVISWLKEEKELQKSKRTVDKTDSKDQIQLSSWNNGWAAGRLTSTLKNSSNSVMRL